MKVVLCALNSKYIHTNLAVRYIKAYADKHCKSAECVIVEETVNSDIFETANKVLAHSPSIVAVSCYIWNIDTVKRLCSIIREKNPKIKIIL